MDKKNFLWIFVFLLVSSSFVSAWNFEGDNVKIIAPLESNGAIPVNIQDQHTPTVIVPLSEVINTTNLSDATTLNDLTINITNTDGFIDGVFIVIADPINGRYYISHQIGDPVGNVITVDTPLDFAYPVGTQITAGSHNLAVDGSTTTRIFSLRAGDSPISVPVTVDVTRIIFKGLTENSVDLSKFGDISGGLTNGLVLRRKDGIYNNIFNIHDNSEIASLMYDFTIYSANNPNQGQNGFLGRLTFAGPSKMGVTIRVGPDDDLQVLIQDDLSSITSLEMIVEGHIVTD